MRHNVKFQKTLLSIIPHIRDDDLPGVGGWGGGENVKPKIKERYKALLEFSEGGRGVLEYKFLLCILKVCWSYKELT